ncbi:MAG: hypothetical protein ACI9ZH_001513 [Paracoccaceae bacterium]|jgi:hypothetical protein
MEEGGRTHTARMGNSYDGHASETGGRVWGHVFGLTLPAFGADSEELRLIFQPGAIKIGGKSAPFAPIRFDRTRQLVIWLAPCIPN